MFNAEEKSGQRWAVILSGGEGERMRPFITSWLGRQGAGIYEALCFSFEQAKTRLCTSGY